MTDDSEVRTTIDPLVGLPRVGHVVADKYRITRLVGVGGMGVVLEAWHTLLEQKVAIKLLLPALGADEEALHRFEREGRTVVRIRSEHVSKVLDVGRLPNKIPYIVMEFLEGEDLAELSKRAATEPIARAVDHVLQACEAVAEAHSHGIIHRDLKPENVFVTQRADGSPCVKVLDFGLSKAPSAADEDARPESAITASRQVMGTPNYMAPEQWDSAHDAGPAADQWAIGAILYEHLCGTPAFGGTSLAMVCAKVTNMAPESLRSRRADVPEALEQAIMRTLEKAATSRYPSLLEFAIAIAPFGGEAGRIALRRISGVLRPGQPPPAAVTAPVAPQPAAVVAPAAPTVPAAPTPLQTQLQAATPAMTAPTMQAWPPELYAAPQSSSRPAILVGITIALLLISGIALVILLTSTTEPPPPPDSPLPGANAEPSTPVHGDRSGPDGEGAPAGTATAESSSVASATTTAETSAAASTARRPPGQSTPRPKPKRSADPVGIFGSRQ